MCVSVFVCVCVLTIFLVTVYFQEILEEKRLEQRRKFDFQGWLTEVRQKRNKILGARNARRQKKANMAKRGTLASQQRMRIISQLAARECRGT